MNNPVRQARKRAELQNVLEQAQKGDVGWRTIFKLTSSVWCKPVDFQRGLTDHSAEFEGFVASDIRGLRDQICTTFGPKVNCVRQVDF